MENVLIYTAPDPGPYHVTKCCTTGTGKQICQFNNYLTVELRSIFRSQTSIKTSPPLLNAEGAPTGGDFLLFSLVLDFTLLLFPLV